MALKTLPRDASAIDSQALADAATAEATDPAKMETYLTALPAKVDRGMATFAVQGAAGVAEWRTGWPELAGLSNEEVKTVMRYFAAQAGGSVTDDGTDEPPDPTKPDPADEVGEIEVKP